MVLRSTETSVLLVVSAATAHAQCCPRCTNIRYMCSPRYPLHPRCVLLGVLHAVHGTYTLLWCVVYHQHVLSMIPSPSTLCGVRGGDVLCMLTHCPCCAAHTTTYACTCNIMLQRPSPMVGAVVLLCGTRSTHSCCTYTPHALCTHYHQHVLTTIPSPTALVAARGDVSDVAPHDALLLYGLWSRAVYTYHQHVLCTDIPLTVHVAHPLLCGDIAANSMLLRIRLQLPTSTTSSRGRYHRTDPW